MSSFVTSAVRSVVVRTASAAGLRMSARSRRSSPKRSMRWRNSGDSSSSAKRQAARSLLSFRHCAHLMRLSAFSNKSPPTPTARSTVGCRWPRSPNSVTAIVSEAKSTFGTVVEVRSTGAGWVKATKWPLVVS